MARALNNNNLSKGDIVSFYSFVCLYEQEIKHCFGQFNIDSPAVVTFCQTNDIAFGKRPKRIYRFVFEAYKPKGKPDNDKAHHLLRHIRNSFCHSLISKQGKCFVIKDFNRAGNLSMDAIIREDLLWSLIDLLIKTKKL